MVPKLFGPIRERYADRPGGYTRVLRIEPMKEDQAESAILELVDGPRDMRFALTAKSLAKKSPKSTLSPGIARHVQKVTQFRKDGVEGLREMVEEMRIQHDAGIDRRVLPAPKKVYPEEWMKKGMHYFEETDDYKLPASGGARTKRRHPKKTPVVEEQIAEIEASQEVVGGEAKQLA